MRALLIIFLFSGCGFDREPPFAGARVPDVAPWQDLGPVTFCDGATRIGVPQSAIAGQCGDPTVTLKACTSDGDCRSRERCTCAGCQVALCDSLDECAPNQVCSFADRRCDRPCTADGDCASGEVCEKGVGVCRAAGCNSDGDCQGGELCSAGSCVTEPCASDGECSDAPSCLLQRIPASLRAPTPLAGAGRLLLWLERRAANDDPTTAAIWRATSTDGIQFRFDPAMALLPGRDPSVLAAGGGTVLVFSDGKQLFRATGPVDGTSFIAAPTPLLAPAGWDASGQVAPSLVPAPAGGFALAFAAADGSGIGLADSSDGLSFTPRPGNPLLTPASVTDPLLWRDLTAVAAPFAQLATSPEGPPFLRLYFTALGRESGSSVQNGRTVLETPNWSIGEAASLDGNTFVPYPFDPVFDRVQNFLDHVGEQDPAVVSFGDGGRQLLYYRAANPDGSKGANLGVAQNPVPALE